MGVFQGISARQINQIAIADTATYASAVTATFFSNATGSGQSTAYGSVGSTTYLNKSTGVTSAIELTAIDTPPFIDNRYRLGVGQSVVQSENEALTQSVTYSGPSATPPRTSSFSQTYKMIITFLGRETITVPAGTYETCKFEEVTPGITLNSNGSYQYGSVRMRWVVAGIGLPVQDIWSAPGYSSNLTVIKATSLTLNGQAL